MAKNTKKVGVKNRPNSKNSPRIPPTFRTADDQYPVWQISTLDIYGPWGWLNIDKSYFFSQILDKIKNFESMKWKEILNRNNHEVSIDQISKDAQKRLKEISLDDIDNLVSLRLKGAERLWGIRTQNIFKILWWDPEHKVYPSKLKHT